MGAYNTFGKNGVQIKIGDCTLHHYKLYDKVDIPDGIYVGLEGSIVINNAKFVAEFDEVFNKWGSVVEVDIQEQNPVKIAVDELAAEKEASS